MPRFIIQRTFPNGLHVPVDAGGADALKGIGATNASKGVNWVQSFVNLDKTATFCVYDAPSPEAIRDVAALNNLPANVITEVRVLDPNFYF